MTHAETVVVPTALVMGEKEGPSGEELISAIVIGYDVMTRVGEALTKKHDMKGFHPTVTCGAFGAAATASKILNLVEEQIVDDFGKTGSFWE